MKSLVVNSVWIIGCFFLLHFQSANAAVNIHLKGKQAKKIYNTMTAVEDDGAAGHIYRKGKSIFCSYTNADMDDSHGNLLSRDDPRRYACTIHFDKHGYATPGSKV